MSKPVELKLIEEMRQLEESLWRSTRYDSALMDETFAADFFEFGRSGRTYERAEMLFATDPVHKIDAILPLPNFQVRYLSDDIVQVTYVSEVKYDHETQRSNRSSIWSRTPSGWQLRFHQGTAISPIK